MPKSKIAITLDGATLARLDSLVARGVFLNRSLGIQTAIEEKLDRIEGTRLARECSKLDPVFERSLAEEGLPSDPREWPEY
jgi:metal-responsive CopG/Arc/MetJ family transcriptional regulator